MTTPGWISAKCKDNSYRVINCYHDGDCLINTLEKFYNTQEKIEELISLGDFSGLGETLEPFPTIPKVWELSKKEFEKYSSVYHRDYNEDWEDVKPREFLTDHDFEEFAYEAVEQYEYFYYWDGESWVDYSHMGNKGGTDEF